ncbi:MULTISPECIES: non-ribosomal peptide synthetase [Actinoalloteichus]|uniref:non-ribosomal peptide synthetase n=1 Tax=Actinoalloteichus TaxID=65496 RepID=UPI0026A85589|nr:CgpQ [Actinoalloteichus caeruleus]
MTGRPPTGPPALRRVLDHLTRLPELPAVVCGSTTLSYRELGNLSAALACRLWEVGVRPGHTVVLRLPQSAEAVAAVLAVLRIGACAATVAPTQPTAQLQAIAAATRITAVVHSGGDDPLPTAGLDPAATSAVTLVDLDQVPDSAPAVPEPVLPAAAPAYLVLTSGTSGIPKAVVLRWTEFDAYVTSKDGPATHGRLILACCRLSWDAGIGYLIKALAEGTTIALPDESQLRDAEATAELAERVRAEVIFSPTSYHELLLDHADLIGQHARVVLLGGEELTAGLARRHLDRLPHVELWNGYGPAETTVMVSSHHVTTATVDAANRGGAPIPIGHGGNGGTTRLLDPRLNPTPPGETGELYLGGAQVALGYLGQPSLTAARFVADPMGSPGARMYRTGDLAVRDAGTGDLVFRGRTDRQIKLRGARVELAGVEAVLNRHPSVRTAVVLPVTGDAGTELVAWCVPDEAHPGEIVPADLRRHCADLLVEQAVPSRFLPLASVPLTSNGKTDGAALRAQLATPTPEDPPASPSGEDQGHPDEEETGRSRVRRLVTEHWAAVLGHRDFRTTDDFFRLGGNSRRVVDLHLRLQQDWPDAVRVGELFDLVTIDLLTDAIAERIGEEAPPTPDQRPTSVEL